MIISIKLIILLQFIYIINKGALIFNIKSTIKPTYELRK